MNPDHHWLTGLKCDYGWEVLLWSFCSKYNQIFRAATQLSEIFPVELGEKLNRIVCCYGCTFGGESAKVWLISALPLSTLNMSVFTIVQLGYWWLMLKVLIAPCLKTLDELLRQWFISHVGFFFSFNPTEWLASTGTPLSELDTRHVVCLQSSPFKTCQSEASET